MADFFLALDQTEPDNVNRFPPYSITIGISHRYLSQ